MGDNEELSMSVEENWARFKSEVLDPVKPSHVQLREMKKAFFAGAAVVMAMMKQMGDEDVSDDEGVKIMESWDEEMQSFFAAVTDGVN